MQVTSRLTIAVTIIFFNTIALMAQNTIIIGLDKPNEPPPYKVTGVVFNTATGKPIPYSNIYIPRQEIGTQSDLEGKFSLTLYKGSYEVQVSSIGYKTTSRTINVKGPGSVNFSLSETSQQLREVVISGEAADRNVTSKDIGKEVMTIESIKDIPPIGGETDILKTLTLLPGVSTVGEASSGFNVRGGGSDQNLILLGGATIYNPSHLFGVFTAVNSSVVREVSLYKGFIPAEFGGRGSSVVDVKYKKGNFNNWSGEVVLGFVTSKFSAGGPILKDKLSVIVAGRAAYPNWLIRKTSDPNVKNSTASFYDGNVILNYILNEKNDFEYSFYHSSDDFQFADNVANEWQNTSHVFRWNSSLSDRLTMSLSGKRNEYVSHLIEEEPFAGFDLETSITHNQFDLSFDYKISDSQSLKTGLSTKFLELDLGTLIPAEDSSIQPESVDTENGIESGAFFQHEIDFTERFGITYGLRYSDFRNLGPGTVNIYEPGQTQSVESIVGTREFADDEEVVTYNGWEPRVAFNYGFNSSTSVKIGYNRLYQYIQLISNTTAIAPTDTWKLSDTFIEPQVVSQYSLGFFKNFLGNRIETSVEGYYKDFENVVDYKDGADLFLNPNLETDIITGTGRAYGLELYLNKKHGRLKGWVSYTYSRTERKFDNQFEDETINDGEYYPSNFDVPHNFTVVPIYRLGRYTTLSAVFTYSTGRPFTIPLGKFEYDGVDLGFFQGRNNERAPDVHRLDVSLKFRLDTKHKLLNGFWNFTVYNLYGRRNAFSVFAQDFLGSSPQIWKLSIIGAPFPTLSYEVKF